MTIATADEALLASLGYKQEFQRAFTPFEVFGVAFSIMGLLPSIASVLFFSIPNGGPSVMVWGWLVCSLFILTIGMSMGELASAAPTSGGLYWWTWKFSSPKCRNLLAWIVGYSNTIGIISGVASIDWGCAVQIMAAASIGSKETFIPTSAQTYAVYAAVVISHGVICSLGTRVLARLQNLYIVLNILLCLAVIIALPIATPKELRNDAKFALGNFTNMNGWPSGYSFFLSLLTPAWTICGFDSAVHISEEASNAAVAVPWAITLSIALCGIIGWAINVALTFCMGTDLNSIIGNDIGQPMATIFFNSFGQNGTLALWAIVVLVQYMMGSSMLLAASRQSFAFARDGALPFSKYLYRMNGYTKTPVNTVWFAVAIALLLGLLAFAGASAINAVFSLGVVGAYIAYSIPIICRFVFENEFKAGPFTLGRFGLPCAVVSVSFMIFMCFVFCFPSTPTTNAQEMNYSSVVIGGVIGGSLIWYYFPKYGGVHWFEGPVANLGGEVDVVKGAEKGEKGEEGSVDVVELEKESLDEKASR
ncbi:APC amino acid permease [Sistotremastrum niveocremeum HHB9708]|uniref:APC amino acid permease n=1 Tax=Sistotremastrum niveocremeum HHB9708 TaxID=1314777 RepID=A0A164MY03_9AGAM|nr:APC amino acid permease [Sistotremastrum niveocremeum HHB9708]